MMRVPLLCLFLAGCATTAPDAPEAAVTCAPLPTLVEQPTATQLAAYAQQVVELYGRCATLQAAPNKPPP
ncbi:hypothetical protein B0G84_5759 [Paraburkholderia sp. BL8N3]|nr:hypothetical protein [Paraburkholderia sp. BL8N3]TCK36746.1 hypothetical protein B0G84_5759 [Paraburkholderia sp. BL8N3]